MAAYWRGVVTNLVYQFKDQAVPANFVDNYGNPLQVVPNYTNPQGITEDLVICLPYGGVQLGYAGPPSVINPPPLLVLAPGHIFSPWEQEGQPNPIPPPPPGTGGSGLPQALPFGLGE